MHSNFLRKQHITGVLAGVAVGNALGFSRANLSRDEAQQWYGKPQLSFQTLAGGVYSTDTHLMLMTAQALLNSRTDGPSFRYKFRSRLSWYPLSLPLCGRSILTVAAKSWLCRLNFASGVAVDDNSAAATAIFTALAIHGTGHRIEKWVDETTRLTLTHVNAVQGCRILCTLAHTVATSKGADLDVPALLALVTEPCELPEFRTKLEPLGGYLQDGKSPEWVAEKFGWGDGIGRSMIPTTIMAIYCWLRSPRDFETAVLSAIGLGGDSSSLGAVVGGLVGAYAGLDAIPADVFSRLGGSPHGPEWITALGERFSHWPHGEQDLHMAPAESSDPPMQLMRNIFVGGRVAANRLSRYTRSRASSDK